MYIVEERVNGNYIAEFDTYEDAQYQIKCMEETDQRNGEYEPNHYQIAEV